MKHIEEPARRIPVMAETDVLVVGGGPAGLAAALGSARAGAQTMLVERAGCFGGVIAQAMIGTVAWYRTRAETVDAGGIGVEFERRAKAMGASVNILFYEVLDTEMFKHIADEMVLEAGVRPLLHTWISGVILDGETLRGVITESKSGRQAILAKRIIDATGDADVAARAGVPFRIDSKEELEEVSVNFGCSGIDTERFLDYVFKNPSSIADWGDDSGAKESQEFSTFLKEPFKKAKAAGEMPEYPRIESYWSCIHETGEMPSMNAIFMGNFDGTDVEDLTAAEIEGRKQVMWALAALKKYVPGFEKARLRTLGASLGVRETRKIEGLYNLTGEDVKNQARFPDSIGINAEFLDGNGIAIMPSTGRYFQVPFGVVLPVKVDNLLVAGRCVAGDKVSHAAMRQMMSCTVTGQGAGVAAAVSVQQDVSLRELAIADVQTVLRDQGVRLE